MPIRTPFLIALLLIPALFTQSLLGEPLRIKAENQELVSNLLLGSGKTISCYRRNLKKKGIPGTARKSRKIVTFTPSAPRDKQRQQALRLKFKQATRKGKQRIKARLRELTEEILEKRRACATPDQAIGSVAGTVVANNGSFSVVGRNHPLAISQGGINGVTVRIQGSSYAVRTDSSGYFRLNNAPAGPQALLLSRGDETGSLPVTVVAGATILPGSETLSREDALALVQGQVLDALPDSNTFAVQASQNLIPKGVRIATEDPVDVAAEEETVANDSWLFFVDLFPTSAFGHPTKIILVDDQSGTLSIRDEYYQPIVNDHPL